MNLALLMRIKNYWEICLSMIFVIFSLVYIGFVTYSWGIMIQKILSKKIVNTLPFSLTILLGLVSVVTLGSFFSLFMRINWEFQLIILLFAALSTIKFKIYKKLRIHPRAILKVNNLFFLLLIVVSILIIMNATTLDPKNPDTGIYHAQAIRWIETYPVVPGLANLHHRFGYNSSWLMANAVFSFPYMGVQSFHLMTGFLFTMASLYFSSGVKKLIEKKAKPSHILKLIFLLATFIFLLDQSSSPGTDAPAAVFVWIILCEYVRIIEENTIFNYPAHAFLLILSGFTLTVKLSTVPILILIFMMLLRYIKSRELKQFWFPIVIMVVILLLYLARNLVLTGYLVFPGLTIDPFKFDWRLPVEFVKKESEIIRWFAILPNSSLDRFRSLSTRAWMTEWFLNLIPRHKALIGAVVLSPIILLISLLIKKTRKFFLQNIQVIKVMLTCLVGVIFWFSSAPAIRFGYGFIIGLVATTATLITYNVYKQFSFIWIEKIVVFVCLLLLIGISHNTWQLNSISQRIYLPKPYPKWSSAPCEFKNFTILCSSQYNSCWYDPFPCGVEGDKDIEMRSLEVRDGYRYNP